MSATELLPPYKVLKPRDHTTYRGRSRERLNKRKNKKRLQEAERRQWETFNYMALRKAGERRKSTEAKGFDHFYRGTNNIT